MWTDGPDASPLHPCAAGKAGSWHCNVACKPHQILFLTRSPPKCPCYPAAAPASTHLVQRRVALLVLRPRGRPRAQQRLRHLHAPKRGGPVQRRFATLEGGGGGQGHGTRGRGCKYQPKLNQNASDDTLEVRALVTGRVALLLADAEVLSTPTQASKFKGSCDHGPGHTRSRPHTVPATHTHTQRRTWSVAVCLAPACSSAATQAAWPSLLALSSGVSPS